MDPGDPQLHFVKKYLQDIAYNGTMSTTWYQFEVFWAAKNPVSLWQLSKVSYVLASCRLKHIFYYSGTYLISVQISRTFVNHYYIFFYTWIYVYNWSKKFSYECVCE